MTLQAQPQTVCQRVYQFSNIFFRCAQHPLSLVEAITKSPEYSVAIRTE